MSIPVIPAPLGSSTFQPGDALNQNGLLRALLASTMLRAGINEVVFTQDDLNAVTGLILLEGKTETGHLVIGLGRPLKVPS
jgi:hypothetical protein